jgi:hypothetical protein
MRLESDKSEFNVQNLQGVITAQRGKKKKKKKPGGLKFPLRK